MCNIRKSFFIYFVLAFFVFSNMNAFSADLRDQKGTTWLTIDSSGTVKRGSTIIAKFENDGSIRKNGIIVGKIENDGTIKKGGMIIGKVESDGTVKKGGMTAGKIENDGTVKKSGMSIGKAQGVNKKHAAACYFFDFF